MPLIRFGEFAADPATLELWRDGRRVRMPPQSFRVLLELIRQPGELVPRETLHSKLWPHTTEVEYEQGLNAAINRLREALGDSAAEPRWVETLPRRGYRFIGKVIASPAPEPAPAPAPELTTAPAPGPAPAGPPPRRWLPVALVIGLAVGVALAAWLFSRRPAPDEPGRLVPYTALDGEERAPSFSPDGARIAFAWNGDPSSSGRFDLYVKAAGSEQLLRLTKSPARSISPAWSPDAKSIAFTRQTDGPDGSGLYLVPAMGGAERRIAEATFADSTFMQLSWSPDGRRIAFSPDNKNGATAIRIVDVANLAAEELPGAPDCWKAGMPAFSARGDRLAFVCLTSVGVYGVYVAGFDARPPARIATVMGEPRGLAWEADARSLIVANDAGDGGGLWNLSPDGEMTRLPFGEEGSAPARSGNDVAYVRTRQSVGVWRMDLSAPDPATTARRLISSTRSDMTPQYSPDGTKIVFQSNRSGSAEIWLADADGANPLRLTEFNGPLAGAPQWCSDGKRIAFDARAEGDSAIWIVDIDERKPRRIGRADTQNSLPLWSADCRAILASDGRRSLYKLPVGDGSAELFTQQQSYYAQRHGDVAIFNVKQSTGVALWSRPIAGGAEAALPGMPVLDYEQAWAVAPTGIYYTTNADGKAQLLFYDFATQSTHRVATLARTPAPGGGLGLAVSPDGRWLLFTQAAETQSDIMVMDNP